MVDFPYKKAPVARRLYNSGDKGIRTPDLTGAIRALYQLSYIPIFTASTLNQPALAIIDPTPGINRTMGFPPLTAH